MSDGHLELDAAANDAALLAAEAAGRPAFAVDAEGEIVWAGEAGFALVGDGSFDEATRRALARMASSRSGGLVRLRFGGTPIRFRARPIAPDGDEALLGLEALAGLAAVATPAPAEPESPVPPRDVADEEGVEAQAEFVQKPEPELAEGAPAETVGDEQVELVEATQPETVQPRPEGPAEPDAPESVGSVELVDDLPPDPRRDLRVQVAQAVVAAPGSEPLDAVGAQPALQPEPLDEVEAEPAALASPAPEPESDPEPVDDVALDYLRFAFEIDAASRVTFLSQDLRRAVGPSADGVVGRLWREVASDLALDRDGAVAAALESRGSWSDIRVSWPLPDGRRAPLSLSALPMFDRGRAFVGFRGLGRSIGAAEIGTDPAEAAKSPREEPARAPEPPQVVSSDAEQDVAFVETAPAEPTEAEKPARYEPPALIEVTPPAPVFTGNVVPLRETPPLGPGLSMSEESAFDEIARRLRGIPHMGGEGFLDRFAEEDDAPAAPAEARDEQRELPFAAAPEELLRLIDRLPVGALVLRGGEIAHANRSALELLGGRSLDDLAGRGADTLFAEALPQDRDAPAGAMRLIAANGGEVEVDARLSTIAWGGTPATLVTLRRPDAARDAELRERDLAAALDVAADGVITLDGAGRILSVNRGAETLFGVEARDVVGSLFTLSLAPESRRAAFEGLDRLKADGAAATGGVEVLGLSRQGGAIPLLMTIGRIAGGAEDRFCAVLRDIGPWKRAEEELIAARRQAERANTQKSEFLAKVGHEIRSPLNAIIGFAEVMMEERFGPVGSPRYKDYLRDIHASGDHLVKMVDDLLDLTRIESGKLKLDVGPIDLNEIASQAAALLQPQAHREHVIIRTSLARGLPPVMADRRSVRQIMTNLAANAVKLSRAGGQVIVATALNDVGQAVFRVRDAGVGMSKQEIARAFEPFRPLAVADNDSGANLGLPLTRALAEANEAVLALRSEAGRGTLAEVTFPASRVLAG